MPQITVITGTSAGGGCYGPALTDFVIMTSAASMFLTGPAVVREVMGEDVTAAELGSSTVQARNGVSHFSAVKDFEAALLVRRLLGYLPQHAGAALPGAPPTDPAIPDPAACVPELARRVYDVRDVLAGIADADSLLEVAPRWATNLLTGFARLEGRPVGVVANQPRRLGGVLDAAASEKGARFVDFCDAFGLPLVVLVDTPGFLPGTKQELAGVIRHGATLVRAFARATVPRATVVLRKAFGGAYITMNSKDLGADLVLAWPRAQLGIIGAEQAVGITERRAIAASADPHATRRELAAAYAERHLTAHAAACGGHVDELVAPVQTRARLREALR